MDVLHNFSSVCKKVKIKSVACPKFGLMFQALYYVYHIVVKTTFCREKRLIFYEV